MAFDDVRLPEDIERGAKGGPRFMTTIIQFASGIEQRNQDWDQQRCEYDIGYGIESKEDWMDVLSFFYARRGRHRGFRYKDWADYQATDEILGIGDDVNRVFQLQKTYGTYVRKILRPVNGTVKVYVDGVQRLAGFAINYSTGVITFNAPIGSDPVFPATGQVVSASFDFDVPVRFESDNLQVELEWELVGQIGGIRLLEIKGE